MPECSGYYTSGKIGHGANYSGLLAQATQLRQPSVVSFLWKKKQNKKQTNCNCVYKHEQICSVYRFNQHIVGISEMLLGAALLFAVIFRK